MIVYIILLILLIIFENIKFQRGKTRLDSYFSNILWCVIVLLAAFRSLDTGPDTAQYAVDYGNLAWMSFPDVAEKFKGYLGYYYLGKLLSLLMMPREIFFGLVEGIYVYALYRLVKMYSTDRIFSILIFITNGLFTFSLAGQKQTLASGLMILAFICFSEKKYIKSILLILWAFTSHSVSLIFLIVFGYYIIRKNKFFFIFAIGAPIIVAMLGALLITEMSGFLMENLDNDHFEEYLKEDNSYSPVTLVFYLGSIIISSCFIFSYKKFFKEECSFIYGVCILACAFQTMASLNPSLFRMALPFSPFFMVLLPNTCSSIHDGLLRNAYRGSIWLWHMVYFLVTTRNFLYGFCFLE